MGANHMNNAEKQYAFSQWPYPITESPGVDYFRMGYTVRSASGYRYTEYVPYDRRTFRGDWRDSAFQHTDPELYDYNNDPHETINQAQNSSYADIVTELQLALRKQFAATQAIDLTTR